MLVTAEVLAIWLVQRVPATKAESGSVGIDQGKVLAVLRHAHCPAVDANVAQGPPAALHGIIAVSSGAQPVPNHEKFALAPHDCSFPVEAVIVGQERLGDAPGTGRARSFEARETRRREVLAVAHNNDPVVVAAQALHLVALHDP